MKDALAFIGFAALLFFLGNMVFGGDGTPSVPLTPEEQARIEYDSKHKEANKLFAYMKKRIPPDATNVKYVGYRWVTFYLEDQCMVAQANERGNYSYLGISAVSSTVCERLKHRIPDFEFTTPNTEQVGGVKY